MGLKAWGFGVVRKAIDSYSFKRSGCLATATITSKAPIATVAEKTKKATQTTISKLTVAVLIVAIATVLSAASAAATFPVGCYCCSSVLETTLNSKA